MSGDTYVLLHRLELEENANQTEYVTPYLFEDVDDAIEFAVSVMRDTTKSYRWTKAWQDEEADRLSAALGGGTTCGPNSRGSMHCVQLTDSDNEVFELYRSRTAGKGGAIQLLPPTRKYTVSMKVDARVDVDVEAGSFEEAFEKAKSVAYDLNAAEVIDGKPVYAMDETGHSEDYNG